MHIVEHTTGCADDASYHDNWGCDHMLHMLESGLFLSCALGLACSRPFGTQQACPISQKHRLTLVESGPALSSDQTQNLLNDVPFQKLCFRCLARATCTQLVRRQLRRVRCDACSLGSSSSLAMSRACAWWRGRCHWRGHGRLRQP